MTRSEKMLTQPNIDRIIRVNQAGEHGATRIYAGQLAVLKNSTIRSTLKEMEAQEIEHLKVFNELAVEHSISPTIFQPIWHVGGYLLGTATALLGEKAAHACTIAVEEVIADHYQKQLDELSDAQNGELKATIARIREEEIAHKDHAIDEGGLQAPAYETITATVKFICKTAIWLSKRV
ncbi:demethoxyubiquinone hydroxylase family protein [Candidatus Paracaedibacter symbiosus]|uniref:demethoxyubiquinone hydroxylase family protein n=1 Tax=Candidatus Paracaedibacter symbiosus TaxID=244582 RepID=UPI000AE94387|nr:demethoxyubiquinone hydroxylase family protein [Candidatus Paracaedibacter symbiosus]